VTTKEAREIFPNNFNAGVEIYGNPRISVHQAMWRKIEDNESFVRCAYPPHGITNHKPTRHCGNIAYVVTIDGYPKVGLCEEHLPEDRYIHGEKKGA
jgi:hypothetical protein